ncbi:terpene synthase family protein [Streptomyces sp. NPDC060028]|uniref:terpene synthase family protein n=1 Tax=Streptomyces sp. NPDC060028 TaxID=3347041 RepID=UPI0036CDEF16
MELLTDIPRACTPADVERLRRVQGEYAALIESHGPGLLSLDDLLSPVGFRFGEASADIKPHPAEHSVAAEVESWMRASGLWLSTTPHIVRACSWVYPTASRAALTQQSKVVSLDWYLNDTQGRDLAGVHAQGEPQLSAAVVAMCDNLDAVPNREGVQEGAVRHLLREMRADSPQPWFACFLSRFRDQVQLTHQDLGIPAAGVVPSMFGYIQQRILTSGMVYMTSLLEFGLDTYLSDLYRDPDNLVSALDRLLFLTAAIPSLGNDVVSFEKEVIDLGSSNNLITVLALNRPGTSLLDAITASGYIVADMIQEFVTLSSHVACLAEDLRPRDEHRACALLRYLGGLDAMMKSQWNFHAVSLRYRYPKSLWREMAVDEAVTTRHAEAALQLTRHDRQSDSRGTPRPGFDAAERPYDMVRD